MEKKQKKKFIILLSLLCLLLSTNLAQGMFTIIPGNIHLTNLNRGQIIERTITVYNLKNYTLNLTIQGFNEGKEWIKFYDINDENRSTPIFYINIAGKNTGNNQRQLKIIISIPDNTSNNNYYPYYDFIYAPPSEEPMAIGFILSVEFLLEVTGEEIKSGIVRSFAINKAVEIGAPLDIYVQFENDGNVRATPKILVDILRDKKRVDNFTFMEIGIDPEQRETIKLEWDTSIGVPENYTAHVVVLLDNNKLGEDNLSFEILPYGSLTQGELFDLSYVGTFSVDNTIQIIGGFRNTWSHDVAAKFIGEIYLEGNLIDTLESPEFIVEGWGTYSFDSYFKIENEGIHTIKGYVVYGGKKTNMLSIDFRVGSLYLLEIIIGAIGLICIVILGFYLYKIKGYSISKKSTIGFTKNSFASTKVDFSPQKSDKIIKPKRKKKVKIKKKTSFFDKKYEDIERIIDEF